MNKSTQTKLTSAQKSARYRDRMRADNPEQFKASQLAAMAKHRGISPANALIPKRKPAPIQRDEMAPRAVWLDFKPAQKPTVPANLASVRGNRINIAFTPREEF